VSVSLPVQLHKVIKAGTVSLLTSQVLLAGSVLLWAGGESSEKAVRQLIAELGSKSFEAREAATRELRNRPGAIPELRQAVGAADQEVARRAKAILAYFSEEETRRSLALLASWGKSRQVDRVVEAIVRQKIKGEAAACHAVATKLAWDLLQRQKQYYPKCRIHVPMEWPYEEFPHRAKGTEVQRVVAPLPPLQAGRPYFVSGGVVTFQRFPPYSLIVATGKVEAAPGRVSIRDSVIFTNGPVDLQSAHDSIIVCDGDCTIRRNLHECLIVARGQVKCPPDSHNCLIITTGEVVDAGERMLKQNMIKQHEPQLLGFADFFDLHREGIDIKEEKEGLRVTAVRSDTAFSRAGLRSGDLILKVAGKTVTATEAFQRLIRRKLVAEEVATFTVRRAERALEVPVEWAAPRTAGTERKPGTPP
jgi:hypothetical protein